MIEEEEINAIKRKNRQADNIMLSGQAYDDDEDNQLMDQVNRPDQTPLKVKSQYKRTDSEEDFSSKKKLLSESDFDLNEKRIPSAAQQKQKNQDSVFNPDQDEDTLDLIDQSVASVSTVEALVGPVKREFNQLKKLIDQKDAELEELEAEFYKNVSKKSLELEGIGPEQEAEIERHRHLYEMQKLMELSQRMNRIEQEKIKLLKKEQRVTARLTYRSKVIGQRLAEVEQMHEQESRERELTLTKLYARLNGKIRAQVAYNEGNLKVIQRKRIPYMDDNNKNSMLFDGIRDQKLKANWIKTPQPVVIKLMTARCMRDKMPKGDFVIRAGMMDRLVENKLYYKFIEYGERVKEQRMVDREKEKRAAEGGFEDLKNLSVLLSQHSDDEKDDDDEDIDEEEEYKNVMARPLFNSEEDEEDVEQQEEDKRKGVHWGADVQNNQKSSKEGGMKGVSFGNAPKSTTGIVALNMNHTKIGFDNQDYKEIYKGQETEKVWIDFGKINSNVLRFDPSRNGNMNFNGHKLYYMLPPSLSLLPSNIIMFELVYLSSKNDITKDIVVGWGAFPIVNGDFEINTGKFKVPILYGKIDFSTNKFKDIEKKYMKNIDEWLCNLYIQVKKIELFDFRFHEEKIEFLVPKKWQKALELQQKANKELVESRIRKSQQSQQDEETGKMGTSGNSDSDSDAEEKASDYSSSEGSVDSDLGFDAVNEALKDQRFEDDSKIKFYDYRYCVSKDDNQQTNDLMKRETQMRKLHFIFNEIINDMGIRKGNTWEWISTLALATFVFELRMVIHYIGQWVYLKLVNAPVISLSWTWYEIQMEYAYWRMDQQLGVVIMGPLANTILFGFFIIVCHLSQKNINCFPVSMCKFIAWYGLATTLDFFLVCVVDMANQNLEGDLFKMYNYYERTQNSGFIGFFMTFLVVFAMFIINIFVFYNYIVFVHNDARIHDIYMRISGLGKGYHIPFDNEISWNYLKQTYCLGEINNNRIVVNKFKIASAFTNDEPKLSKGYQFQRFINEKAVATDEVYYATENGQIFDCDYKNMNLFRYGTLYSLLTKVPSTIGRMARPNNIVDRARKQYGGGGSILGGRSGNRAEGSAFDDSQVSDTGRAANLNLKRRGTVNLVKNFMFSKIQKAQQSGFVDSSSMQGDYQFDGSAMRRGSRQANMSQVPNSGRGGHMILGLGQNNRGALSPGNMTNVNASARPGFLSQLEGDNRNNKTGAPVNFVMQPEGEIEEDEPGSGSP